MTQNLENSWPPNEKGTIWEVKKKSHFEDLLFAADWNFKVFFDGFQGKTVARAVTYKVGPEPIVINGVIILINGRKYMFFFPGVISPYFQEL